MPTCVGGLSREGRGQLDSTTNSKSFVGVRRIILDQLGNRHGRRFDTHWDFVRYAQEKGLNLDFTSPPQRPDPKLTALIEP